VSQLARDVFLRRSLHYLRNGEIFSLGVFAMQEGSRDPGFVSDFQTDSDCIHDSKILMNS
jgi:hypothetical protein